MGTIKITQKTTGMIYEAVNPTITLTPGKIAEVIEKSGSLSDEVKEVALDTLDRSSEQNFTNIQELLGIGFPPEVVDALSSCNEILQLFL